MPRSKYVKSELSETFSIEMQANDIDISDNASYNLELGENSNRRSPSPTAIRHVRSNSIWSNIRRAITEVGKMLTLRRSCISIPTMMTINWIVFLYGLPSSPV